MPIDFETPQPLNAVMQFLAAKTAMPTPLSTGQLTALTREVRQMSLYSARTMSAAYLEQVRQQLLDLAAGKINISTATQNLQLWLDRAGYTPEKHFGTAADESIPPADKGTLRDLSSDSRLQVMLETNLRIADNTALAVTGMQPDALHDYPCWELLRVYTRLHPRGESGRDNDPSWQERFVRAGGKLYGGRMIARKTGPVWNNLGDSGVFSDGTDSSVPPFAFRSGYGWEEVPRQECILLGVIDAGDEQGPKPPSLLGDFFDGHPERATIADIAAKKSDILAALAELKEAA